MIDAIKYNFGKLGDFSGRDGRPTFWWYVLFLVVAQFVLGMLASIPLIIAGMGTALDAAQSGAGQEQMQAEMFTGMADAMGTQIYISAAISVVFILMLAASFVRRLHDGGFSGYLALVPIALQIIAIGGSIAMIDSMGAIFAAAADPAEMERLQAQLTLHWSNIAGWLAMLFVIGFGVMKSQDGPNRYGEMPAAPGR
ncbi:DUF805 domain-containing protein [Aurantiacibacter marinus]|uniref:DUF805 domain-containing protein n=1 Tax=Aurantiacibacter marinus TaxID=874156 RepID=UPI00069ACFEA|nr:DUF805 domain-containing protein [Aurantiacibacter marinus]